ncbi:MAG: sulfurtransferase TusA family protein [Sulfolobus sp.]
MSQVKIYKELDLTSSSCAGPIGELSAVIDELQPGEAVKVILGDSGTKKDIEAWVIPLLIGKYVSSLQRTS